MQEQESNKIVAHTLRKTSAKVRPAFGHDQDLALHQTAIRNERRELMTRLSHLQLRDPADVVNPPALSPPVSELRQLKGKRCLAADCEYLCTSDKRMGQHWSNVHGERESRNV